MLEKCFFIFNNDFHLKNCYNHLLIRLPSYMFYFVKKIATNIALLCLIVGSLSAASIVDNPPKPEEFPDCPQADVRTFQRYNQAVAAWFTA